MQNCIGARRWRRHARAAAPGFRCHPRKHKPKLHGCLRFNCVAPSVSAMPMGKVVRIKQNQTKPKPSEASPIAVLSLEVKSS